MDRYNQSRVPEVYGATISLILLATIAVAARLVARKLSTAKIWWDNSIIVVALVVNWGLNVVFWLNIRLGGYGRHTVLHGGPVGPTEIADFFKLFLVVQVIYLTSAALVKTSLILLYYRIFGVINWFRWLLATAWALVIANSVVCIIVAVFKCRPVGLFRDESIDDGSCIDRIQFYRWNGVANLVLDFAIWTLPLPVTFQLQMNIRQKLSVSAVFLLGLLACVASIIRVASLKYLVLSDATYTIITASIWTIVEQSLGIICACLLTIRPLFRRLLNVLKGRTAGHDSNTSEANMSNMIPLSHQSPRSGIERSLEIGRGGFTRLSEENGNVSSTSNTHKNYVVG